MDDINKKPEEQESAEESNNETPQGAQRPEGSPKQDNPVEETKPTFQFESQKTEEPQPAESEPEPVKEETAEMPKARPVPETPEYVLPPVNYKHKILLMFCDFIVIVVLIYILIIASIIKDIANDNFEFFSGRMLSIYCVLAITIGLIVMAFICKSTKSASTRYQRDNQLRQDRNIKCWLTGFDWGWPILFLPTVFLMAAVGIIGLLLELFPDSIKTISVIQGTLGGIVIFLGALNAAVVIFKLKPVTLGFIVGAVVIILLLMLLHGTGTFIGFFKSFRHLGVNIEPLGYLLIAYIWSIFLRIIWLKSLFFYWVFLPNRLELQHGLSESNDSIDRDDLRMQIDTDDVILRWWNVGIITFYFPQLDRLPITNVVCGIHKKAIFANRIASIKTMQS